MESQNEASYLIIRKSPFTVAETTNKLEKVIRDKGVPIFGRIDMSKAAKGVGLELQAEELLIFGNPEIGTPLMKEKPAIGIELPLKFIIWQEKDQTFVGFHNIDKSLASYKITNSKESLDKIKVFLDKVAKEVLEG